MLRPALATLLAVPVVALGVPAEAAPPTCQGRPATIVGTPGDDRLTGTSGPDVVVARGGDDRVRGLGGDDLLCGGPGADDLLGGPGDDELRGGAGKVDGRRYWGDLLAGGAGDDLLAVRMGPYPERRMVFRQDTVSYAASPRPVRVDLEAGTALGEGADTIVSRPGLRVDGSRGDDVLLGSAVRETLDGGRGDDLLDARAGRDAVVDYHGTDELHGGDGADLVISTRGVDEIHGDDGPDWVVSASWGPANTYGDGGRDFIARWFTTGPIGVVDGGPGGNQLEVQTELGYDEDDVSLELDRAAGTATATAGARTHTMAFANMGAFLLWRGPWTFTGTDEPDFVQVLGGSLDADGLGGDDVFVGDVEDDVLDGGDGTDTAWGGPGRNTCTNTEQGDCNGWPYARRTVLGGQGHRALLRAWTSTP